MKSARAKAIRSVLEDHIGQRRSKALRKFEGKNDAQSKREQERITGDYCLGNIISEGAKCSGQVQIATHLTKGIHPDMKVKNTTNIFSRPGSLPARRELGSHALQWNGWSVDATGNGAVNKKGYELFLLLDTEFDGVKIFDLLEQGDADVFSALSDDLTIDRDLADQMLEIRDHRCDRVSSHTLAKQVYWLIGDDPTQNDQFHLLAPLYPTSLIHSIHSVIQNDRFGETNKAARKARSENKPFDGTFRNYPNLAVQKLGGTKPQNISQLNSERGGINYLLSCAPPSWRAAELRAPLRCASVVDHVFPNWDGVRQTISALARFLLSNPESNMHTRNTVDRYIDTLIDELVQMARLFQMSLEVGWSLHEECNLNRSEQLWLDPYLAETDDEFREDWLKMDWPGEIGHRFANWLNSELRKQGLSVGDSEHRQWKRELLTDEEAEGWAQQLHALRKANKTPASAPVEGGAQ